MEPKKMADQQASQENTQVNNIRLPAQNSRFADRLRQGPIDTFTAIRELNICRPGARIHDLRNAGYTVITQRITLTDEWGRTHPGVAVYSLIAEPGKRGAA